MEWLRKIAPGPPATLSLTQMTHGMSEFANG
jgi:hypothetical protein